MQCDHKLGSTALAFRPILRAPSPPRVLTLTYGLKHVIYYYLCCYFAVTLNDFDVVSVVLNNYVIAEEINAKDVVQENLTNYLNK